MRVTLDTNVLASAFLRPRSVPGTLVRLARQQRFELVLSNAILRELEETFTKPYFAANIPEHERQAASANLARAADLIFLDTDTDVESVATHPEDDLILATVALGQADYLVTGDRQLLALGAHAGARIVTPRAFLALLDVPEPME